MTSHPAQFHRPDVINQPLYVIAPFFNPQRYRSRWKHYMDYKQHILNSGAILITIEGHFGDRAPVITSDNERHHVINLRIDHEIWYKECLINRAISQLGIIDPQWKYVCYVDTDFLFSRHDWVGECLHMLQHYPVIQMFSNAAYLNADCEIINTSIGFVKGWRDGVPFKNENGEAKDESFFQKQQYGHHCNKIGWAGAPGGAWAYTRAAINALGGLYDAAILGSGDYHMATALMGFARISLQEGYTKEYVQSILDWQTLALTHIKKNVGYMKGTIIHYYHGKISDRGYGDRWKILVRHKYNPYTDIKKDSNGLYQLEGSKWQLREDIKEYFRRRNEDSI